MESPPIPLKNVNALGVPIRTDLNIQAGAPQLVNLAEIMESKTPISVEASKYFSVGSMSVDIFDNSAVIKIQGVDWHFTSVAPTKLPRPEMKTLGELTLPISVIEDKKEWFTIRGDWFVQCMKVVNWISFLFPYTKKEFLTYEMLDCSRYTGRFPVWNELGFSEIRIETICTLRARTLFKGAAHEKDVTVLYTVFTPPPGYARGVKSKNFNLQSIPVDIGGWFRTFEPENLQFVLLSSKQIREAHLNFIIGKWTRDELENLVLVRAKYVEDLNMTEINRGLKVLKRKDVDMGKYETKTRFSKFYNEPHYYVVSKSGKVASFHYYPTQGHFYFVVWDSKDDRGVLNLHDDLNSLQDMTSEPIPSGPFRFYDLPDPVFIETLKNIKPAELLIMLEMCPTVKKCAYKHVSAGKLILFNFDKFTLHIGDLKWEFGREPYKTMPIMKKLGKFILPVEEQDSIWYTKTDDFLAQALEVVNWIFEALPLTKHDFEYSVLVPCSFTPEHCQLLSKIDFEECTETNFAITYDDDTRPLFFNQIKNKELIALHMFKRNKSHLNANATNLKDGEDLDVSCNWFYLAAPNKWQFILTSTPKVTEEHLNYIISRWMEDEFSDLVFFRATKLKKLDKAKIFAGLQSEEWNDIAMDEYQSQVHFAEFFEKKGTVFKSTSEKCASFHLDENAGTCHFVVWTSTMTKYTLILFDDLETYELIPTQ
ncbi:hypothetical protein CAEBREN_13277 [Caenorhabditis brenneri]|uniref:Uncharacterized protein n=1 Tax=Caenorhabditis brenneri TaxID=135651 RepID=G0MX32_CAEBE|nr:hypothetical protein CAEBREN_13277 [Caenorhabditis brenneri]